MIYRNMGKTGLKLSVFGLGSWVNWGTSIQLSEAKELLALAYGEGVNFFDNAEAYEAGLSESIMGQAIKQLGWGRDSFVVTSKVYWGGDKPTQTGLSRKHIFDACHASLKRLQVDYLDVYYCHRPDIETPISETVTAMSDLVRQGKVLYWGTSEWEPEQIVEAKYEARLKGLVEPVVEQPEYNMFTRQKVEKDFLSLFEQGLGLTTYSPLAGGLLTGKYINDMPETSRFARADYQWLREAHLGGRQQDKVNKVKQLFELAAKHEVSLTELSLVWTLNNNRVSSVILGASNPNQLQQNIKALGLMNRLPTDVFNQAEAILANQPVLPERF